MFQQGFEKLQTGGEGRMGNLREGYEAEAGFHLGSSEQSCPSLRHPLVDMHQGSRGMPLRAEEMGAAMTALSQGPLSAEATRHGFATLSRPKGE